MPDPNQTIQQIANAKISDILRVVGSQLARVQDFDLVGANAAEAYTVYQGADAKLVSVSVVPKSALTTADAVIDVQVNGDSVGSLTIPLATAPGSAVTLMLDDVDVEADDVILLLVGGGSTTGVGDVTMNLASAYDFSQ